MKKTFLLIVMILSMCFTYGCGDSSVPDKSKPNVFSYDLTPVYATTAQEFMDKKNYPMVRDIYFGTKKDDKKVIVMSAMVGTATSKRHALELADTMIRRFAANATTKYGIAAPSNDSYGGLFDNGGYTIYILIAANESNVLYEKFIMPGLHTKQGPDWKNAK